MHCASPSRRSIAGAICSTTIDATLISPLAGLQIRHPPRTHRAVSLFEPTDVGSESQQTESIAPAMRRTILLEHPTLAVAAIQKGRIRETNAPWRALFALPSDVSLESHVAALFSNVSSADRFERALRADQATRVGADVAARVEHMLVRRDGTAFLAEVVVALVPDADLDRPLAGDAIWQVRDITVERTLRRELRDLEDYHRELSRHQPDLTFVIDRKGRIAHASSSVERVLGYRVHALLGTPFAGLIEPAQAAEAERWLRAVTRQVDDASVDGHGFALRVLHGDGSVRGSAAPRPRRRKSRPCAPCCCRKIPSSPPPRSRPCWCAPRSTCATARLARPAIRKARGILAGPGIDGATGAGLVDAFAAWQQA